MFGGGFWGSVASGGGSLVDRERAPPARPIPLEFPNHVPSRCDDPLSRRHIKSLCKHLVSIRRPVDVQDSHLAQFNIQLDQDVKLADLVPAGYFESRPFLYDDELTSMLSELAVNNEDAYREVLRLPPLEGRTKPRLAYSRNFFATLEDMSRYWDVSEDNYYEVEASEVESVSANPAGQGDTGAGSRFAPAAGGVWKDDVGGSQDSPDQSLGKSNDEDSANIMSSRETTQIPTRSKMRQVYKGHRLGNGEQMSPGTRVAAIRNLLKMAVHKFNCRDYEVNPREKFKIRNICLPSVFYNFCVARIPSDMKLARARMVEGPLLAVHSRTEVRFKSRNGLLGPTSDFVGERYDLFREMSGLLMLASQRARQGQQLSKEPREDQWWAIKSRWGGGQTKWGQLANEVYEDEDPSWGPEERRLQSEKQEREEEEWKRTEAMMAADLKKLRPEDLMSRTSPSSERPKKKKKGDDVGSASTSKNKAEYKDGRRLVYTQPLRRKWYQEWLNIRPNLPNWDEKIIFKRIGMPSEEEGWDDVYMISAANHHACIVKLSVHEDYLEWLDTGRTKHEASREEQGENQPPDSRQKHLLYMSRSHWYDLFEIEQRQELLTGDLAAIVLDQSQRDSSARIREDGRDEEATSS